MLDKLLSNNWTKFWFALSVSSFIGLQISSGNRIGILLNIPLAFALALFIAYKYKVIDKLFEVKSKKYTIISILIAVYTTAEIILKFYSQWIRRFATSENPLAVEIRSLFPEHLLSVGLRMLAVAAGIVALFFVFAVIYRIISLFKNYTLYIIKSVDKNERLYIIIGTVILAVFIIYVYSITEVSYQTQVQFDLIFTTDSGNYIYTDVFFSLYAAENDIRQPLFALLTMPFAVVAKILAIPLFFLPSAYILIMQLIQVIALLIMAVLIARMSGIKESFSKTIFLILFSSTYPFLLFSFVVEQYIPSVFILVLVFYICLYKKRQNIVLLALSSGILLTNAIIVPFITYKRKIIAWIQSTIRVAVTFILLCLLSGKLSILFDAFYSIRSLLRFSDIGNINSVHYKIYQFTSFIENCFIAPNTVISGNNTFQLTIPMGISLVGVALLCISIVSVILNREMLFARICGLWVLFSIVLLYVIGWGSPENGMVLYSLYFNWAYFALVFLFIEKLFEKLKYVKYALYLVAFVVMAVINIGGIVDLVRFGIQYYPAR